MYEAGGGRGRSSVPPELPSGFVAAPDGRKTVPEGSRSSSASDGFVKLQLNFIGRRGRPNAGRIGSWRTGGRRAGSLFLVRNGGIQRGPLSLNLILGKTGPAIVVGRSVRGGGRIGRGRGSGGG